MLVWSTSLLDLSSIEQTQLSFLQKDFFINLLALSIMFGIEYMTC